MHHLGKPDVVPRPMERIVSYRFSIGQSLVSASIELLLNLVDAPWLARHGYSRPLLSH
jgi:hypothetical protein